MDGTKELEMHEVFSLKVNRQVRKEIFQQSWFTNRFLGSEAAVRAEASFQAFVSRHHLPVVRKRLWRFALLLMLATGPEDVNDSLSPAFLSTRTVIPSGALVLAALLCGYRRTRRFWRLILILAMAIAYAAFAFSDWVLYWDIDIWSVPRMNQMTMWQLVWFLFSAAIASLFLGLDLVPAVLLTLWLWLTYAIVSTMLWVTWHIETGQPDFTFDDVMHAWHRGDHNITFIDRGEEPPGLAIRVHIDCLIFSAFTVLMLLGATRRMNSMDRRSFVNLHVLQTMWSRQQEQLSGKEVELLALFSNPVSKNSCGLRPLQLGQAARALPLRCPISHALVATGRSNRVALTDSSPRNALPCRIALSACSQSPIRQLSLPCCSLAPPVL